MQTAGPGPHEVLKVANQPSSRHPSRSQWSDRRPLHFGCSVHSARCSASTVSFNPHENPKRQELEFYFTGEETEAQR